MKTKGSIIAITVSIMGFCIVCLIATTLFNLDMIFVIYILLIEVV